MRSPGHLVFPMKAVLLMGAIMALLVIGGTVFSQETGEYDPSLDDGRLNIEFYLGGLSVYCVDPYLNPADFYTGGGGFRVLDPEGHEILFVPEAVIEAGIAQTEATGQYTTLGVSERLWYGGQPVAIYRLASNEFQLNAAGEYEKPLEFRWWECRHVPPLMTNDGCAPGWDRNAEGVCYKKDPRESGSWNRCVLGGIC